MFYVNIKMFIAAKMLVKFCSPRLLALEIFVPRDLIEVLLKVLQIKPLNIHFTQHLPLYQNCIVDMWFRKKWQAREQGAGWLVVSDC